MFALAVAPMLFLCALLMAYKKTMLIGYLSALLFASASQFQNQMTYDPVGLINTSIAAVIAAAAALVLWAILVPQTPEAARRRLCARPTECSQGLWRRGRASVSPSSKRR